MLSFECIKNEKSVYFLLTSAMGSFFCQLLGSLHLLSNLLPNIILTGSFPCQLLGSLHLFKYSIAQ